MNQFISLRSENIKLNRLRKDNFKNELNIKFNPKSFGFTELIDSIFYPLD